MSDNRPSVDFSKLSWGSIKRYESLYGVRAAEGQDLVDAVKEHFGMMVYNDMKSDIPGVKPYGEDSALTCDLTTFKTNIKTPNEIIESFLRITPDDKDEGAPRKSTRFRDKPERKS